MNDSDDELDWHSIGRAEDLRMDPGARVVVAGRAIALFPQADGFVAVDDNCPHQGASLAEGDLFDGAVRCPWHGWKYDLRTGMGPANGATCIAVHPIRGREDGTLEIGIAAAAD